MNWMFVVKTLVTVAIIVGVSEVVKRSPSLGALIVALPFPSLLVMTWMHIEGAPASKIAQHSSSTFWFVLPTLPFFIALPQLLKHLSFGMSIAISAAITFVCFGITMWALGIDIRPT